MKPRRHPIIILMLILAILWTACTLPKPMPAAPPQANPPATGANPATQASLPTDSLALTEHAPAPHPTIDLEHLPIGDGRVSTQPRTGYIWSCNTRFTGRGAFASGSWVRTDGTFDFTAKLSVDGQVSWPSSFTITLQGEKRVIEGNDLPKHPTGIYPVSPSDDAYQYDRNPNSIRAQTIRHELPASPALAGSPSCLPMGQIGVLLTGSYFFNALDAAGNDAVAHEIQDDCHGHPEQRGFYHYHNLTLCLDDPGAGHSALLGYAMDGFGIYGLRDEDGEILTNASLDECHGHTHEIEWDGRKVAMYHYHATYEYPYTMGCFRGAPVTAINTPDQPQPNGGGQGAGGQQPPQEAIDACLGLAENAACTVRPPNGGAISGVCAFVQQQLACIPTAGPGGGPPP